MILRTEPTTRDTFLNSNLSLEYLSREESREASTPILPLVKLQTGPEKKFALKHLQDGVELQSRFES